MQSSCSTEVCPLLQKSSRTMANKIRWIYTGAHLRIREAPKRIARLRRFYKLHDGSDATRGQHDATQSTERREERRHLVVLRVRGKVLHEDDGLTARSRRLRHTQPIDPHHGTTLSFTADNPQSRDNIPYRLYNRLCRHSGVLIL